MSSKHSPRKCRECHREYVPAKKKYGGFIYLCDTCSYTAQFEDGEIFKNVGRTDRYVGKMTEKGNEGIIIFRSDIASHKSQLMMESRRGMSPNLNITSPVNELVRQQEKEGKEVDKQAGSTVQEMINTLKEEGTKMEEEVPKHLDITGSEHVEIVIRDDASTIWVNTAEGHCILRICRIKNLTLHDMRKKGGTE